MNPAQKKAERYVNSQVALIVARVTADGIDPALALAMIVDCALLGVYNQGRLDGLSRLESMVFGPEDLPVVKPVVKPAKKAAKRALK